MLTAIVDDPSFSTAHHEFTLERHRQQRKRTHLQLSSDSKRIKYRATNFGENSAATLPYHYAVALIDTERHTAELFDAELFISRRIVKNLEKADAAATSAALSAANQKSNAVQPKKKEDANEYLKSRALLGESFGTAKTKKILSSIERNKINMDQLASQAAFISKNIDTSISRTTAASDPGADSALTQDAGEEAYTVSSSGNVLPPHNPKTSKVEDIYRVHDLIAEKAYASLDVSSLAASVREGDGAALERAKRELFLRDEVEGRIREIMSLERVPDEAVLTHTLRCLVYMNYMLLLRELNETKINCKLSESLPMASADLLAALLSQFTEAITTGNGKQRHKIPAVCKDRLMVHICILALTLDGFRTNVAKLSVALRISTIKANQYLKAIGCVIEKPGPGEPTVYPLPDTERQLLVRIGVLRAPLTILPIKARRGKAPGK